MTQGPSAVTGPPVHLVHHREEVMGTIVVIDVFTTAAGTVPPRPAPPGGRPRRSARGSSRR